MERRRRDKINNWIVQLSKIIPDCSMESTKSGQVRACSRPGSWGCTQQSPFLLRVLRGKSASGYLIVLLFLLQSKGGILSKACDYIQELRQSNHRLSEELQGLDQLQLDNEVLRQQVSFLSQGPSRTPKPLSPVGTLYFIFHRLASSFPLHQRVSE